MPLTEALVMEDLAVQGPQWGHATRSVARTTVDKVVAHVAAMHARTWESIDSGALFEFFLARLSGACSDIQTLRMPDDPVEHLEV